MASSSASSPSESGLLGGVTRHQSEPAGVALLDFQGADDPAAMPRLFMNLLSPQRDDIAVVGLIQPDSGQWGITDLQAALVARMARAAQHAPRAAGWLYRLRQRPEPASRIRYVDSPRHALEVEHYSYRRRLERLIASLDRRLRREASPRLATSRSGRR